MKEVKIYTMTDAKSPKMQRARGIYILATETGAGVADLTKEETFSSVSANQAELRTLIAALKRLTEPCEIVIFTECGYVRAGIEDWLAGWRAAGWKRADGQEVKNVDEWKELDALIQGSSVEVRLKENHNYKKWMIAELRRDRNV